MALSLGTHSQKRLFVIVSLILLISPASAATQERAVVKGEAIEQQLSGGGVDVYTIHATAGQFLHLVVEQKGIDVVVRLLDATGKQIIEVDGPNGAQGFETMYVVIPEQGNHRIEIRSLEKNAAPGKYQLLLKDLRQATTKDIHLAKASKTSAEAFAALVKGTAESLMTARTKFEEALADYRLAGDTAGEADALTRIGDSNADLGDNHAAVKYYNLALPLWRSLGNLKSEAITLSNLAFAHDSIGEGPKALEYYDLSLVPTRKVGDVRGEAITLNNIGVVYNQLGEKQAALDHFSRALAIRRKVGDRRGEAITLNNIGVALETLGELQKALDHHHLSLAIMKSLPNQRGEASTLSNIAKIHALMLDYQKARTVYEEALALHRIVGNRIAEANALTNLGRVEFSSGSNEKALEYLTDALKLLRDLKDRRGEANSLAGLGDLYASKEDHTNALSHYQQALPLWKAVGDLRGEADTLYSMARVELKRGNLTVARDAVQSAIPLIEFMRRKVGGSDLRASYFATAQKSYELLIEILMRLHASDPTGAHDVAALRVTEQARARSLLELLAEARADIRQGVNPSLVQREHALQQQRDLKVEYQFRLLNRKHPPEQAAATVAEIDALTDQLSQVQSELRATSPAYTNLTHPQTLSLKEIQQIIDPQSTLLEYSMGEERSYLWLVSKTGPVVTLTLPKRAEIEAAAQAWTRMLSEGGSTESIERAARDLSRIVLAPAAQHLRGKRLVIVADGALHYVPFAALPLRSNRPLLVNYEVVNLPSASTLAALREMPSGQRSQSATLAIIADPVFRADDPRVKTRSQSTPAAEDLFNENERAADAARSAGLKRAGIDLRRLTFSRQEAEGLIALLPARETFVALDFAASQATVHGSNISEYRLLHIATHGYLNPDRPEFSGLVLSLVDQFGEPQDGFLSLSEIYNLKLNSDLVVLSACQTGLGRQVRGEGLVGLTRGFMYAGSPRVVASLWAVGDRATAELMQRFYTAMLRRKLSPAAALRAAQLSMLREPQWSAPHQWAGFVFQGEWN